MKSERELRSLVEQSQEDGFRAVFDQYRSYVSAIIWNRIRGIGSYQDAEEAVSDVFAALFRNFDSIEDGKLENYIRMLSKRTAVDTFRRLSARPEKLLDDDETWIEALSDENIELDYDRSVLRHQLMEAIWSLGEPDATIVILTYYYHCSAEQIGKQIGLNRFAVSKRLSRSRKKLRELLNDLDISL